MKYFLTFIFGILFTAIETSNGILYVSNTILDDGHVESISLEESSNSSGLDLESEILETQVGKLSRYGPDCFGCSGYVAHGENVLNGNIYYLDSQYGEVRILAGDRGYPFGTIVRVVTEDEDFLSIVLDRGGAIGFSKTALFDLLYPSERLADADGINLNVRFEILRYGF